VSPDVKILTKSAPEDLAAELYSRRQRGDWGPGLESELQMRIATDPRFADAWRRVEGAWKTVGSFATSPELMALREQAIARTRRATARRWRYPGARSPWKLAAALAGLAVALATAVQISPLGYRPGVYRTSLGEQRIVDLPDGSRVALDARTRLRVQFSQDARVITLTDGQAQFNVAQDPARPFKVLAGGRAIVALGTVFTVAYMDREVNVAMLEGKVAVVPEVRGSLAPIELAAGEGLHVTRSGETLVTRKADLEAATAWREGKIIFHSETLADAVARLNRYSRVRIEIQSAELAGMKVSGVFEAGDTAAFSEAVESYLPVTVDRSSAGVIRLELK
jgi:transmembrane sensor